MASIKEKHKEIFDFLMEKHRQNPELRFLLRLDDTSQVFKKGHWFHGFNDEYLIITFWNAWDNENNPDYVSGTLNIQFRVKNNGECEIELSGESTHKAAIIDKIANSFDGFIKGNNSKTFSKKIEGNDYKKNLSDFILSDKPLIDSILHRYDKDNKLFPEVTEEKFNRSLTIIKNWQSKEKTLPHLINNSVKLLAIRIENIKRLTSVYVHLDKPIVCIYGKNGTGKTTLLRSIAIAIAGQREIDKINFDKLKSILKIESVIQDKFIYTDKALIELTYSVDNLDKPSYNRVVMGYKSINDSLEIKNDGFLKGKPPVLEYKHPQAFNLYGQEKNIFKTLILGFAQQVKKEARPKTKNVWSPNIDDFESLIYDDSDSRFAEFVEWVRDKIAPEKVASFDQRQKNREQINEIFKIISSITADDMKLSADSFSAIITNKSNPNGISLELMSQGYQNIVAWVGYFIKRLWEFGQTELPNEDFMQMPAICLIDEIDTYLHSEWQYRILSVLSERFKNVQFIVTSHSPFVLSSIPNEKILKYELIEENGEIIIKENTDNLYGAQINDVAKEMGTTKRFGEVDDKVEGLLKKIYENDTEGAKEDLVKLEIEIDPEDSDLRKAATLIKTKEIFKQRSK